MCDQAHYTVPFGFCFFLFFNCCESFPHTLHKTMDLSGQALGTILIPETQDILVDAKTNFIFNVVIYG